MNGEASSREPMDQLALLKRSAAAQELHRALHVRWLGRMEFAEALAVQEEIVAKKRNDRSFEDFFSNMNPFTQLDAHLIGPACPPQDKFALAN